MITKKTLSAIVYAGECMLKPIIEGKKLTEKYDNSDIDIPSDVFEFFEVQSNYAAYMTLIFVLDDMDFGIEHSTGFLMNVYNDAVSMCLFDKENADKYLDLVYEFLTTNCVPEELNKIEDETPTDIRCWVRKNLFPPHPLFKDLFEEKLFSKKQDE